MGRGIATSLGLDARRVLAASVLAVAAAAASAQTLPPGFVDTVIVPGRDPTNGVDTSVAFAYEPGTVGDMLICEKGISAIPGPTRIRRYDAETGAVTTALTLDVDASSERGILGIAFDPDFATDPASRFVYVFYTPNGPPYRPRVSRFVESGGILSGEQVLLEIPSGGTRHVGGCLRFAADKTLYISSGDHGSGSSPFPDSRDLTLLTGKILRINRDGTIPADNPFVGAPGARAEIWECGLRNPWRFDFDPSTGTAWIGDVGEDCWESVAFGLRGADHGWPCWEGTQPFRACSPAPATASVTFPTLTYGHGFAGCDTPVLAGASVVGGPVYRRAAFPAEYRDSYYLGDYNYGWIARARLVGDGTPGEPEIFARSAGAVDFAVSPSGCLAYATFSRGVHEICYTDANQPPWAVIRATPAAGLTPLDVAFDGSQSTDGDLDPLTHAWEFGDSTMDVGATPALHRYAADGVYTVRLTVNDGCGVATSADDATALVVVGNRPPVATITSPAPAATFNAGDTIRFAGSAADPEDGTLGPDAFEWMVFEHAGTIAHPIAGGVRGVDGGQFVATTSRCDADVFYRIWLTVRDSGSPLGTPGVLSAGATAEIHANAPTVTLATSPPVPGLELGWDGSLAPAPSVRRTLGACPRRITAPTPQLVGGDTWELVGWSDGGAADHDVAPTVDSTFTASFRCMSGAGCVETGRCTGGVDDDGDTLVDCADADCAADAACAGNDLDGDGAPNGSDCAPLDASAFAIPREIARLDVAKRPGAGALDARLSWTDQSALAGSATVYDVASGLVGALARPAGADGPCTAADIAATSLDEAASVARDALYYLVRGGNACGEGPWGTDSLGAARPACP